MVEALVNKKNNFTQTCQIVKPSRTPNSIYFIHLMKKYFLYAPKFRFFSSFFKILNLRFWRRNRMKLYKINWILWSKPVFKFLINKNKKKYLSSIVTPSTKISFYSKIPKWQKDYHQAKENWKSANLPNSTDLLNRKTFTWVEF